MLYPTIFTDGAGPMVVGDFTGNGIDDILVFSKNQPVAEIFLGNGNGTFTADPHLINVGEDVFAAQAVEFNGTLGMVTTGTNSGNIYVIHGQRQRHVQAAPGFQCDDPESGRQRRRLRPDGRSQRQHDRRPIIPGLFDLVVSAQSRSGAGSAEVILLPAETDSQGNFTGYGSPIVLATVTNAGQLASGDFTGNGATDVVVAGTRRRHRDLRHAPVDRPEQHGRDRAALGSVAHLVTLPQAIVSGFENAYYTYDVPTEAVAGSGDEVIDFSALFQDVQGAGLEMDVTDASGPVNVIGTPSTTGDRYPRHRPPGGRPDDPCIRHDGGLHAEPGCTRWTSTCCRRSSPCRPTRWCRERRRPASSSRSRATSSTRPPPKIRPTTS